MNFIRVFELFLQNGNNTQDSQENNTTRSRQTSIDHDSLINDNNSNNLECHVTFNNVEDSTNDSAVTVIEEYGTTKILHNLENVAPVYTSPNDNTRKEHKQYEISLNDNVVPEDGRIFNNITKYVSLVVNDAEDEPDANQLSLLDLAQIQDTHKATVSNGGINETETYPFNNVIDIDDETIENFKEFEALNNIDKTALADDSGTELINLDDFMEMFDKLNAVNEDLVCINDSVSEFKNNEIATYCKENKTNLNTNENIDIISINSSTDVEKSQTKETEDGIIHVASDEPDSDDSYNSSDFEFISETEANMAGFLINCDHRDCLNLSEAISEPLLSPSGQYYDVKGKKEAFDPGRGPSRQNRPINEFEGRSYRNRHHIPIGDDYLGLFQGIYNPQLPMSEIHFLENKSVRASAMNSLYDEIGFERQMVWRRHQPDSSEDEFEDEAKESAKEILNMYPGENRKKRRRYL